MITRVLHALVLFGLFVGQLVGGDAQGQVSVEPILRIETGGHQSLVTRVSTDAQGRWILTASEDKTARLWDASTGKLLSVMRPPIGSEGVGAISAAALSPDGKQIALGGNAAFDGKTHSLYLFDRASGRLPAKSTLSGLEAPLRSPNVRPEKSLHAPIRSAATSSLLPANTHQPVARGVACLRMNWRMSSSRRRATA